MEMGGGVESQEEDVDVALHAGRTEPLVHVPRRAVGNLARNHHQSPRDASTNLRTAILA